ncbi:nitronate monooxygenase [Bryocella elongata]|uniref:Nitronate monooxygenase n=2 Tax=Bryocella elongata TaxID=863522 RepID=A0A1H5TZ29_9BACT|nr:nitronate monooxygenase [Bryocella elongata]
MNEYPVIIQGGMGAGVSNWQLARAVSKRGQLGVVSGTALDQILVRRLQDGDPGGHMRRALLAFPFPSMADNVLSTYFVPGGKASTASYMVAPMLGRDNSRASVELCIVSNFVEVFLARKEHDNPVGINYLEKIQAAHLPTIYGAMLAGVSYIIMGAGIPLRIPGVLDGLARHEPVEYAMHVTGAEEGDDMVARFNPRDYMERELEPLLRPQFLPIVSSNALATTMVKKANGVVNGLVIEMSRAGGHNAPPRGKMQLNDKGEPVYGERDQVDFAKLRELGVPFWLAGGYGSAEGLKLALQEGATGIQVGTAFEFADESGLDPVFKSRLLAKSIAGTAEVFTDPVASPTGFPFKVGMLEGTGSDAHTSGERPRICDLGFLREAYRTEEGGIGYRCPAEPLSLYVSKGGKAEDTVGRKCLCNALLANVGLGQVRNAYRKEIALVTVGDDLKRVWEFLPPGETSYTASDVIDELLTGAGALVAELPELEPVCTVKA